MSDLANRLEAVQAYFDGTDKGQWEAMKVVNEAVETLRQIHSISKDIIEKAAWRDHWEPDHAGGENARDKVKQIIQLSSKGSL
ncbi:hypothetical protein G6L16_008865 [Agrobacterium tumefaciens]|uniref:hypothetical protein n=1 Tax=Agrobacterium tumefaciens TaxID=358 RepID=UPI001571F8DE|nr:hypothetical protein [Agrobacterium tumefaciens]NSZ63449.1 hypothetical protein [Agrobacterium tumefaciens]NTA69819.1 hypothetical protein [Agrobacterium tumefaciens]WIE36965.1 hypothetical protein G6L16_008865 [Agrobacterium tumefaciens]